MKLKIPAKLIVPHIGDTHNLCIILLSSVRQIHEFLSD